MKILVVNPNSSSIVTAGIEHSAKKRIVNPNTEIIMMQNSRGTKNIDCTFADFQSTYSIQREVIEKVQNENIDAVVLAGFGNIGIYGYREVLDIPVLNMSETSMTVASTLGHKFTVLTTMANIIPSMEDLARVYRLEQKIASIRSIEMNVEEAARDKEKALAKLKEQIVAIVENDNAEVVILGSGGLCTYADELEELVGIPVIDPVCVAVKMAEMMVETGLTHSKKRKFAHPPQSLEEYYN